MCRTRVWIELVMRCDALAVENYLLKVKLKTGALSRYVAYCNTRVVLTRTMYMSVVQYKLSQANPSIPCVPQANSPRPASRCSIISSVKVGQFPRSS